MFKKNLLGNNRSKQMLAMADDYILTRHIRTNRVIMHTNGVKNIEKVNCLKKKMKRIQRIKYWDVHWRIANL